MRVIGVAGWSGSGKTTLLEQVVPQMVERGLSVSMIKHASHAFDVDRPDKDSYRLREAGCREVLLTSSARWALMHELRGENEPTVFEQIRHLSACDIVLVEGFKNQPLPKLEVYRPSLGKPPLYPDHHHILSVASDIPLQLPCPFFLLDDIASITIFLLEHAVELSAGDLNLS